MGKFPRIASLALAVLVGAHAASVPGTAGDAKGEALPEGALFRFGSMRWRHGAAIAGSELSPDGKLLATADGGSVVVWELASGRRLHCFLGDAHYFFAHPGLAFSPDARYLAYTQHPGFAALWDLKSGKEIRRFKHPELFLTGPCRFGADGQALILAQRDCTEIIDIASGKVTRTLAQRNIALLSANGQTFVQMEDIQAIIKNAVILGDVHSGKIRVRVPVPVWHEYGEHGIALAPDGRTLAVIPYLKRIQEVEGAKGKEFALSLNVIELRDTVEGKVQATFAPPANWSKAVSGHRYCVGFSGDGQTVWLAGGSGVVYRWDVASRKELAPLEKHLGGVTSYHELPDGKTVITTGGGNLICRWDRQSGRELSKGEGYCGPSWAACSPDGAMVAIADCQGRLDLWDITRGLRIKSLRETGPRLIRLAFAPDGKSLAALENSGMVPVWELAGGKRINVLKGNATDRYFSREAILFSPDGRFLLFNNWVSEACVWEVTSGKKLWSRKGFRAVALSADGNSAVASMELSWVTLLDLQTGKERSGTRQNMPKDPNFDSFSVYCLAATLAGRQLAVGSEHGSIALLDGRQGAGFERFLPMPLGLDRPSFAVPGIAYRGVQVEGLSFSPDGRLLVSGRGDNGVVRVHEVLTGKEVLHFQGHEGGVSNVAVSPEGRKVLSSGYDGQAYLWDLRPAQSGIPRKTLAALWNDLAADDARQAYRAVWALVDRPAEASEFLSQRIAPVKAPPKEQVAKWIDDLDDSSSQVRTTATKALAAVGPLAESALHDALKRQPTLEAQRRIRQLLDNLKQELPRESIRQLRAAQAMELAGTAEARQVLRNWARGASGALLTEDARAALKRLDRSASPTVWD
jgi:WD40 repeat protein